MSRIEGKIGDEDGQPVDAAEILAALARERQLGGRRKGAVSCYLSASEGWREAAALLGGAFATRETGLSAEEEE